MAADFSRKFITIRAPYRPGFATTCENEDGMVIDGVFYALGLTAGGVVVGFLTGWGWAVPLFVVALFCLYFFRDPDREIPSGPVAVSPADGKVVAVKQETPNTTRI